jgi:hypothetical protein
MTTRLVLHKDEPRRLDNENTPSFTADKDVRISTTVAKNDEACRILVKFDANTVR